MLTLETVAAEARKLPGHFKWPRKETIRRGLIFVIVLAVVALGVVLYSNLKGGDTAPALRDASGQARVGQPVVQPVQQAPVVPVAPIVKELPKVHVEWVKIGTARNGNEVVALGMPRGDEFICVPAAVVENLPPGFSDILGGVPTGMGGIPTDRGTVILYTYAQTEPWVYTYWRTTTEIPLSAIEGLSC